MIPKFLQEPCETPTNSTAVTDAVAPSLVTSDPGLVAWVPPPSFTGAKPRSSATSSYIKRREYWIFGASVENASD
ncbi:hypothetical protein K0M31_004534 [Melipona bicolor]|uniref:Uncharacterized protein n=1 Tax=Melipona bicolor TaxID=60889 RepID=A0AA40FWY9_9HYME|nr:hypothetical protein K0M31_004534 [Melipona bicolor]